MEGEGTTQGGKQEEVSWEKQEMMAGMNREQTADVCSKYKSAELNRWRTGQFIQSQAEIKLI